MKFAIEEINNSTTLLPGIVLGYDIYDNCMAPRLTLQPSLLFLAKAGTSSLGVLCDYAGYQTRVMAVVGPHSSELCTVTARLFSLFLMPQVSYGATTEKLNNEGLYPSFFRSVPSDKSQLEAMMQLLVVFQWNWISVVASDDGYGREGLSLLSSMVANKSICVAYEGLIPSEILEPGYPERLKQMIQAINETNVNVVILFSSDQAARALFQMWVRLGLGKKVWIGTQTWVVSDAVTTLHHIRSIGTVIGFVIKGGEVPGFQEYVHNLLDLTQGDSFCQASQAQAEAMSADIQGPPCEQCNHVLYQNITAVLDHHQTFAVYVAVHSVAHALHELLRCQSGHCRKSNLKPGELINELRKVNFSIGNQAFHFNQDRSIDLGYKVIWWHWRDSRIEPIILGHFNQTLHINKSLVQFHTPDQTVPPSECLTTCPPGQIRQIKGFHLCCYDCIDCEKGTFSSSTDDSTCSPCPEHQWSPPRSTRCYSRSEKYLSWSEPLVVALLSLLILTFALTCLAGGLFLRYLQTPAAQATGGTTCLLALFSLALMGLSSTLYVGKPSTTTCLLQQPICALCLNACFSTIAVKAFQIMLANDFGDSRPNALHFLARRRPWAVVAWCFLVEILLCTGYLYASPSLLVKNYKLFSSQVLLQCKIQSWAAFAIIHGHNSFLAFISFLCTFMVPVSPKHYNLARGITFAAVTYFITLVVFIPTYASVKEDTQPAVQMGAMLLCIVGLLATYYLPKCYIFYLKPEQNRLDYFQDYTKERQQEQKSQD
ncbi:taste receptor type 1 member 3 [Python bivittatus]|uniref:Taste receptor type 1 member 3 n=1 Tax=Python bivittatus TaxID=176946 RepID=A0A9F5J476_PYTBI|nr:taste receptor type 1 member 3 [Python bivittatus]